MEIVYVNQLSDLVAFQLYHYDHDARFRRLQTLLMIIPAIFVIVFLWLQSSRGASLLMSVVGAAVILVATLAMRRFIRRRLRDSAVRTYARGAGRRALGEHRLILTDEGIVERSGEGAYTTPWSSAFRVIEVDDAIYIYTGPGVGLVIPLERVKKGNARAFANAVRRRAAGA